MEMVTRKNLTFIAICGLMALSLVFSGSALMTPKYQSEMEIIFIQKQLGSVDVFTATKSAERIADSFNYVIHSSNFLNLVLENKTIDRAYFRDPEEGGLDLEKWKKTVTIDRVKETGVMQFSVYHPNRAQSNLITSQIFKVLQEKGPEFHGGGSSVKIVNLNEPKTALKPGPNILLNSAAGLIFGLILGAFILSLYPQAATLFFTDKPKTSRTSGGSGQVLIQRLSSLRKKQPVVAEATYSASPAATVAPTPASRPEPKATPAAANNGNDNNNSKARRQDLAANFNKLLENL